MIEDSLRLDIRMFHRRGWLTTGSIGTLRWSRYDQEVGSIGYRVRDNAVVLHYQTTGDDGKSLRVEITVPIVASPCRYGGQRRYWRCPRCTRRCEVLVVASGGRSWGCRGCLRLRYACQGLAPADRMQARASKMFGRLGGTVELYGKPKWMRWRTFNRLEAQAQDLDAAADAMFAFRCMARFGMLPDDLRDHLKSRR